MSDEKLRILKMVETGTITAEEASQLLSALNSSKSGTQKAKWLKIRVFENASEKPNVKVSVPIAVAKLATKIGGKFHMAIPDKAKEKMEEKGIDLDAETFANIDKLFEELAVNGRFDLVNVCDEDDGDRVEIYVE